MAKKPITQQRKEIDLIQYGISSSAEFISKWIYEKIIEQGPANQTLEIEEINQKVSELIKNKERLAKEKWQQIKGIENN